MGVTGHSRRVVSVTFVQGYLLATVRASVGGFDPHLAEVGSNDALILRYCS